MQDITIPGRRAGDVDYTFPVVGFRAEAYVQDYVYASALEIEVLRRELLGSTLWILQRVVTQPLERISVTYPKTWWDALKARWFPRWAKERWPVAYVTAILEAKALYPKIALPDHEHSIHLELSFAPNNEQREGQRALVLCL